MNIISFIILLTIVVVDFIGITITLPMLPSMFLSKTSSLYKYYHYYNFGTIFFGLHNAVFALGGFFGSTYMGDVADKWGRKKTLFLCLAIMAISYLFKYVSLIYGFFFIFFLVTVLGGFFGAIWGILQSIAVDLGGNKNKDRYLTMVILASAIGTIIGPVIVSLLHQYNNIISYFNEGTPFLIYALLVIMNFMLLFLMKFKDKGTKSKINFNVFTKITFLFKDKYTGILFLSFSVAQFCFSAFLIFIAIHVSNVFHGTEYTISITYIYLGIGAMFGTILQTLIPSRHVSYTNRLIICLFLLIIITLTGTCVSSMYVFNLGVMLFAAIEIILYSSFVNIFTDVVDQKHIGLTMGSLAASFYISNFSASLLISGVSNFLYNPSINFWIIAIGFFISGLLFLLKGNYSKKQILHN